ncbi:MAG TPA: class I SAM-dependent methyltransferase [Rhizomicrobium sp.]|nr:class I SAM-dependent methyltransferase [Rhizomicrobium sp.]
MTEHGPATHAEAMDRIYRTQRRFYDLTRKYYLFGRDRLIGNLGLEPGQTLAEIGCGTARNLIAIARRYPGAKLYGLDASSEMLKTADAAVRRSGLSDRIGLAQGYAEMLSPQTFGLDKPLNHIVFSYSLSMIPDWRGALAAAAGALGPDGLVHMVDFGDLKGLPRPAEAMLRAWLNKFQVVPRDCLLAALESRERGTSRRLQLLPGRYSFVASAGRDDPILQSG